MFGSVSEHVPDRFVEFFGSAFLGARVVGEPDSLNEEICRSLQNDCRNARVVIAADAGASDHYFFHLRQGGRHARAGDQGSYDQQVVAQGMSFQPKTGGVCHMISGKSPQRRGWDDLKQLGMVGQVASEAGVKLVVLSHVIPRRAGESDAQYVDCVNKFYSGPVAVGKDLMEF
jgi:hypothetical protein